jgi:hypothetical protein
MRVRRARARIARPAGRGIGLALVALLALGCSDRAQPAPPASLPPFGIDALTDLAGLAELRPPGWRVEQVSSYDRTGGNADLGVGPDTAALFARLGVPPVELDNSFLYRDGDRFVIFDALGPGLVDRIWMTGLDALFQGTLTGDIAFELDDEPTPRLRLTRSEMFSGTRAPFLFPLAGDDAVSSGGFYSVVPIPFARHLRITTSNVPNWVHVTWTRLPPGTALASFDPAADTSEAAQRLAATGADPKGIAADEEKSIALDVAAGASSTLWTRDGPGTVLAFELLAPPGHDIPTGLRLQARFDGAAEPQIDAPLDDLFGASLGPAAKSIAFGRDGDRFYLYLPMPFHERAELVLRNDGTASFDGWQAHLEALHRVLGQNPGLLHAASRAAHLEPDGQDYTMLDTEGTGHVVAVVVNAGCGAVGQCQLPQLPGTDGSHLEGDERIFVDGSRSPQIHGTGFEDFFSGGFYFVRGAFTLPTHGNPAQVPTTSPRRPGLNLRSAYRLFLGDAILFQGAIRLGIEHGPTDDVPAEMSSLVYYYAGLRPSLRETDRVEIGDATSESAHAFSADGRVDRTLQSQFPGDDTPAPVTASGVEAVRTRFRVAIDPGNAGVRLRRTADMAQGRQSAAVTVNGKPAGTWLSALINPNFRFADLDFDLPPELTRGESSLDVELDASGSEAPWTAYGYAVLSSSSAKR